jgi:hypothetical protein
LTGVASLVRISSLSCLVVEGMMTVANECVTELRELAFAGTTFLARYPSYRWMDRSGIFAFYIKTNSHDGSHSCHLDKHSTSTNEVFPFD